VPYKTLVKTEKHIPLTFPQSNQVSVIMPPPPPPYVTYLISLLVRSELPLLEKRRPESMAAFL
jgi:hypothetical protein